MPDKRGRVTVTLKPSHLKELAAIQAVTGKDESEVLLDGLKFMHRDMIHTGEINVVVDNDVVVQLSKKIAVMLGNTGDDSETAAKTFNGNSTVN